MSSLLEAARAYAAQGIPVFPVNLDKTPLTKTGFKEATTDPDQIKKWWSQHPLAMIGIPTGKKTDLLLLDVDAKNGVDGRKALKALGLDLSACPMACTPSGGSHYYYRLGGRSLRNSQSKIGVGLDTRGEGGFAIVPPSAPNPKRPGYGWVKEVALAAAPVIPDSLVALLAEKTDELTQECAKIRAAEPGTRNSVLNAAAFRIAKIVLAGRLREDKARQELTKAARDIGLGDDEILKTLNSAFSAREREKSEKGGGAKQGRKLVFAEIEPWDEQVDGRDLIDELTAAVHRHVILTAEQATAVALWIVHTHCLDAFQHSPRLHLSGPLKRCGKTTLLSVVRFLVPRPVSSETLTVSVMFRLMDQAQPTLLIDEADVLLAENYELIAALNSGYERHGMAHRITGDDLEVRGFSVWGPVAIAGIGKIRSTLADRSIRIDLERKKKIETISRLDAGAKSGLFEIARRIARWSKDHLDRLRAARPELPSSINDRAQDVWTPLMSIAVEIDETTRLAAWQAALTLTEADSDAEDAAIALLTDMRELFDDQRSRQIADPDKIASAALVIALINLENRPWGQYRRGKPIVASSVARILKPFKVKPENIRFTDGTQLKGYERGQLENAWTRYL